MSYTELANAGPAKAADRKASPVYCGGCKGRDCGEHWFAAPSAALVRPASIFACFATPCEPRYDVWCLQCDTARESPPILVGPCFDFEKRPLFCPRCAAVAYLSFRVYAEAFFVRVTTGGLK